MPSGPSRSAVATDPAAPSASVTRTAAITPSSPTSSSWSDGGWHGTSTGSSAVQPRPRPLQILAALCAAVACLCLAGLTGCKTLTRDDGSTVVVADWPRALQHLRDFDHVLANAEFVATEHAQLARKISALRDRNKQAIAAVEPLAAGEISPEAASAILLVFRDVDALIPLVPDAELRTKLRVGLVVLRGGLELFGIRVSKAADEWTLTLGPVRREPIFHPLA